jgi:acetyl esterase/lipase
MRTIRQWLLLIFCAITFGLSAWIIIPAPIFTLLPLSVGTPEISPLLLMISLMGLIASLLPTLKFNRIDHKWQWLDWQRLSWKHWRSRLALAFSVAALILSALPLVQWPMANQAADRAFLQTLGPDYLAQVPAAVLTGMRSSPFVLTDLGRKLAYPAIRETLDIPFAQPQGVPLTMNSYRPAAPGRYPAIVTLYGGAWQRGKPAQDAAFNRYIAAQGYAVWAIDYRHAPQHRFPAQIEDVKTALTFIQQHAAEYDTDMSRVALMGRSAGAQLAMLAAYRDSPIPIRAVVDYYGPVDLTAGYYDLPMPDPINSRAILESFLGGPPPQFAERYRQASPLNAVGPGLPPSLLIYGGRDHIVELRFGRHLAETLTAQGNQAVFIEIPWADHAFDAVFSGLSNQMALYYTERFLAWALQTQGKL